MASSAQDFVEQALAGKVPGQMYANPIAAASYPPGKPPNVLQRFLDTVRDLVAMGFFVLLDNQMQQDKLVRVCLAGFVRFCWTPSTAWWMWMWASSVRLSTLRWSSDVVLISVAAPLALCPHPRSSVCTYTPNAQS